MWNEPNQPQFLLPQYSAVKHTPLSPRIYRNLFLAAERGLRAGGLPNAPVLIGETSPRGTGSVVAPLTFLRGVFCLDSKYRKVGKCAELHPAGEPDRLVRQGRHAVAHHRGARGELDARPVRAP